MPRALFWNVSSSLLNSNSPCLEKLVKAFLSLGEEWKLESAVELAALLLWLVLIFLKTEAVRCRKYFLCPTFQLFCRSLFWDHASSAEWTPKRKLARRLCLRVSLPSSWNCIRQRVPRLHSREKWYLDWSELQQFLRTRKKNLSSIFPTFNLFRTSTQ